MVSALVVVLTFVSGVALARILGPEGRGYYGSIQMLAQFGVTFFTLSLFDATILRIRNREESPEGKVPFVLALATVLLVIMATAAGAAYLSGWLAFEGLPTGAAILCLGALVAIGLLNKAFISIESAALSFGRLNLERVLSPSLFLVAALALWWLGVADVVTVLLAFILAKLPILLSRFVRHRSRIVGAIDFGFAREVLALGPRLHAASGTLSLSAQADRLIIIMIWPAEWLGYYFVAYAATGAGLSLASQAIGITLLPSLAGLPVEEQRQKIERLFRLGLVCGLSVAVPIWIAAPFVVEVLYGSAFGPAAGYIQGLMFAMLFRPARSVVNVANRSQGVGRPGVEVALVTLATIAVGYGLTGFARPVDLFVTLAVGNVLGLAVGMRHLVARGVMRVSLNLVPQPSDLAFLFDTGQRHVRKLAGKVLGAGPKTGSKA